MNRSEVILTELLSAAIRKLEFKPDVYEEKIDWEQIFQESASHQVHTLIYPTVSAISGNQKPDSDLLRAWKNIVITIAVKMRSNINRIEEIISKLQDTGIQVIALKGLVLNRLYPYPELRTMGDADVLIHNKDMDAACKILVNEGYVVSKDKDTKHVELFHPEMMNIELHRRLTDYNFIKNRERFDKLVWEEPVRIAMGKTTVLSLAWEIQILHICLHLANHIVDGGIGLRQLCDLVLAVESKMDNINWNFVIQKAEEYGVDKFVYALFQVCNRLLRMKMPTEISDRIEYDNKYVDKLISDILSSGNFGRKNKEVRSANILLANTINSQNYTLDNKLIRALTLLFPTHTKLSERYKYMYVKKYPFLTPIAWIHRIFYGIFRKDFDWKLKADVFNNDEFVRIAEERDDLLHWLGLR